MYDLLHDMMQRPEPFSRNTTKELWTRPHLAQQMLQYHLNQDTELASRPFHTIDKIVDWIDAQLTLKGKRVCDLGCGPGLYTQRFTGKGAEVTGIDFSQHSLDYAQLQARQAGHNIVYLQADYLVDDLPTGFDVITLIYLDLCVLSPDQRNQLLERMRTMLNPGGHIVIDVAGIGMLEDKQEFTLIEERLMHGFWAPGAYIGIQRRFIYPDDSLYLDRYLIVEPHETFQIYNWFQHFTAEAIQAELHAAGFTMDLMVGDLTGNPITSKGNTMGIIASPQ
jgi:SAM-dependent methyltransferase